MRYATAGESHGRALCAIVSHVPAGIPVDQASLDRDLARRQQGYGRGGRQRIETDRALVMSGVRFGETIGSPVCLTVANRDWDNWTDVMAPFGTEPESVRETSPRPGHADLPGVLRTRSSDARDILERASARETAARVAAGGIAKAFLRALGVEIHSFVDSIAGVSCRIDPASVDWEQVAASDVSCPDETAAHLMREAIDAARADGESVGGTFVVVADGLLPGMGGYAEPAFRLDADIASSVMSIPAIKGVEIGDGFSAAARRGSEVHDAILYSEDRGYYRDTNRAGGIEGGMTNGELLVVRAAMKPIPTLMRPLASVDIRTHQPVDASKERSDVCAVPAAAVVAESEVAFALARAHMEAFGGTSMDDILASANRYRARCMR